MINFIPIFPLDIVVYPGEPLNLHIFEPRYKQLIKDCIANKKQFGIPAAILKKPIELGTRMEIVEIVKEYENGEMDIRTRGMEIFKVLETVKDIPEKLYHGAIVDYPQNVMTVADTGIAKLILDEVKRMYTLMGLESKFPENKKEMISYEIAHLVGFSKEQEYELMGIFTEVQRLEYIRRHLKAITPVLQELENMKARVQMNGHFRNLSLDDLSAGL
jgi:Lon protease-like protein